MPAITEGADPVHAPRGAHVTVIILAFAYLLSFVDRMIPSLLIDPIRADLAISDSQVALLVGFAFAIVYTTAAVPISWLADRWSRKLVLIGSVLIWGAMTIFCGLASGFAAFFVGRMGVGLGEAALTPTAYALLTDLYPPSQRSRVMSVFVVGGAAGAGIALLAGAAALGLSQGVATLAPWRSVLVLLGSVTMLTAVMLGRITDVPARAATGPAAGADLADIIALLWRERLAYAPLFVGVPLMNLALYGSAAWGPSVLIRRYGWSAVQAGEWLGGTQVVLGIAGTLLFGWLGDRDRRRGGSALLPMLTASCAAGAIGVALIPLAGDAWTVIALLGAMTFVTGSVGVLAPVALQAVTAPGTRARTASLFLLVANLVGIGAGPSSVAIVNERLFGHAESIGDALAFVCALTLGLGAVVTWLCAKPYAVRLRRLEA